MKSLRHGAVVLAAAWLVLAPVVTDAAGEKGPRIIPRSASSRSRKPESRPSRKLPPLTKEAARAAAKLKTTLPPNSEARLMLDAILQGRMGPNDGWFGVAKAQTRFDWKYVAKTFDRDHDGKVTAEEFRGRKTDFARLDVDRDGVLTEADFSAGKSASRSPGEMLFYRADRDGNGRVTKEEIAALFQSLDSENRGFLSLEDLANGLQTPAASRKSGGRPNRNTLVIALAKQELGALTPGPAVNEKAPDFTLPTADNLWRITLSKEIREKPVVLIFGSFT